MFEEMRLSNIWFIAQVRVYDEILARHTNSLNLCYKTLLIISKKTILCKLSGKLGGTPEEVLDLISAYVLAKVEAGKDEEVLEEIRKIAGIKRASPTYGMYDLHVEVSFESIDELDKFIFDKMRRIPGIKETVTLIASKGM